MTILKLNGKQGKNDSLTMKCQIIALSIGSWDFLFHIGEGSFFVTILLHLEGKPQGNRVARRGDFNNLLFFLMAAWRLSLSLYLP